MQTRYLLPMLFVPLALGPASCSASWSVGPISKEEATKLGIEVGAKVIGKNKVSVELQLKTASALKNLSRVELQIMKDNTALISAALKEDRGKPGYVTAQFTAAPDQLETIMLRVWINQGLGGVIYELPMHKFINLQKSK